MNRKELMEMFNRHNRIGVLATAGKDGAVNTAVFGSPRMIDDETIIMAIGENRTYRYLQENPRASFIVVEPGDEMPQWRGARLYLEVASFERFGELLDSFREKIRKTAGSAAADSIRAAIRFKITDVRPLVASGD